MKIWTGNKIFTEVYHAGRENIKDISQDRFIALEDLLPLVKLLK